ncbi:MAG: PKD domain-containing protein, partial [Planctomycetota bacterium]
MILFSTALMAATLGGCPSNDAGDSGPAKAEIGISSTQGDAPLRIQVSGSGSTSTAGRIVAYAWDFGGLGTASTADAVFTFNEPGKYDVRLVVTDDAGNTDDVVTIVQARGGDASVEISATPATGRAPLRVQFGVTVTSAETDPAEAYIWDFNDGDESSATSPVHTFSSPGTYVVSVDITTESGATATDEITITVSADEGGSLQFGSGQFATLPLESSLSLSRFTFEAWVSPETAGGALASFGTPSWSIEIDPADSLLRVRTGGTTSEVTAAVSAGRWQHIAFSYDSATGGRFYLNGAFAASTPAAGTISVDSLRIGSGLSGKMCCVRFWSIVRTNEEISESYDV